MIYEVPSLRVHCCNFPTICKDLQRCSCHSSPVIARDSYPCKDRDFRPEGRASCFHGFHPKINSGVYLYP